MQQNPVKPENTENVHQPVSSGQPSANINKPAIKLPPIIAERLYNKMVAEVRDYAILLLDLEGNILTWNTGAAAIKGYDESEIIGKNFRVFYLPPDRENKVPEMLLDIAFKTGRAVHEGWRLKKDGTQFWGSVVITALHDDNGEVIGFSKLTRDLTQKKEIEENLQRIALDLEIKNEQLRRSEERYHRMVSEVEDYAIILLDVDGNILNWNKGAEKIKGYKEKEIIGKSFQTFYLKEDRDRHLPEKLLQIAVNEKKATHEGWRLRKDGSHFWGSIVITALHNEAGDVMGFSKVTRDLTQKKESEDFILMQNKQLVGSPGTELEFAL